MTVSEKPQGAETGRSWGTGQPDQSLNLSPSQHFSIISSEERRLLLSLSASKGKKGCKTSHQSPRSLPRKRHKSGHSGGQLQFSPPGLGSMKENSASAPLERRSPLQALGWPFLSEPARLSVGTVSLAPTKCSNKHTAQGGSPARKSPGKSPARSQYGVLHCGPTPQLQETAHSLHQDTLRISQLDFGCSLQVGLTHSTTQADHRTIGQSRATVTNADALALEILSCNPEAQLPVGPPAGQTEAGPGCMADSPATDGGADATDPQKMPASQQVQPADTMQCGPETMVFGTISFPGQPTLRMDGPTETPKHSAACYPLHTQGTSGSEGALHDTAVLTDPAQEAEQSSHIGLPETLLIPDSPPKGCRTPMVGGLLHQVADDAAILPSQSAPAALAPQCPAIGIARDEVQCKQDHSLVPPPISPAAGRAVQHPSPKDTPNVAPNSGEKMNSGAKMISFPACQATMEVGLEDDVIPETIAMETFDSLADPTGKFLHPAQAAFCTAQLEEVAMRNGQPGGGDLHDETYLETQLLEHPETLLVDLIPNQASPQPMARSLCLTAAAIVPTQQVQAALHDALKGTQNIEQSAALNRCGALCVPGCEDPVSATMLAESEEGCSQICTMSSPMTAANSIMEKLTLKLLQGDCMAWAHYVRLNSELDLCDNQIGPLSDLARSRLGDVFIQFYDDLWPSVEAQGPTKEASQSNGISEPLSQADFPEVQEAICLEEEAAFRTVELEERGWLDALSKYEVGHQAAAVRRSVSIIPDSGTDGRLAPSSQHACLQADTSRLPQKETTLPPCDPIQVEDIGNTSQQEASQKEPECAVDGAVEGQASEAPHWFFARQEEPCGDRQAGAACPISEPADGDKDLEAGRIAFSESQHPVAVPRRRPLLFNETLSSMDPYLNHGDLPSTASGLQSSLPGISQVSRVPETHPSTCEDPQPSEPHDDLVDEREKQAADQEEQPAAANTRKEVGRAAGLKLPHLASQDANHAQKVVTRLSRRQRKKSLFADLKDSAHRRKVLMNSQPNGFAEHANKMAALTTTRVDKNVAKGTIPARRSAEKAAAPVQPNLSLQPLPDQDHEHDDCQEDDGCALEGREEEFTAVPLTIEQFPAAFALPSPAEVITAAEDRAPQQPHKKRKVEGWLPFSTEQSPCIPEDPPVKPQPPIEEKREYDSRSKAQKVSPLKKRLQAGRADQPKKSPVAPKPKSAAKHKIQETRPSATLKRLANLQQQPQQRLQVKPLKAAAQTDPFSFPDSQPQHANLKNSALPNQGDQLDRDEAPSSAPKENGATEVKAETNKGGKLTKLGCSRCKFIGHGCDKCRPNNLDDLTLELRAKVIEAQNRSRRTRKSAPVKRRSGKQAHTAKPREAYGTRNKTKLDLGVQPPAQKQTRKQVSKSLSPSPGAVMRDADELLSPCGADVENPQGQSTPEPAEKAKPSPLGRRQHNAELSASRAAQHGATENEVARAEPQEAFLKGQTFLLTGQNKRNLGEVLKAAGATIISRLPPPEADSSDKEALTAVIGDPKDRWTSKLLLALMLGRPILSPTWVEAVRQSGKAVDMAGPHLVQAGGSPWQGLHGMHAAVHSSIADSDFATLLSHAGAQLRTDWEAVLDSKPRSPTSGPKIDLLLVHQQHASPEDAPELHRFAHSQGISIRASNWFLEAAKQKRPLHEIQLDLLSDKRIAADHLIPDSASPDLQAHGRFANIRILPRCLDHAGGQLEQVDPGLPRCPQGQSVRIQLSNDAGVQPSGHGCQGSGQHKLSRASAEREGQVQVPKHRPRQSDCSRRASLGGQLTWLAPAGGPPQGCNLPPSLACRTYYTGFIKDGVQIRTGDAVLLQPRPGDEETGVGVLEAMWADAPAGCPQKWQARCRKFYRPSETSFGATMLSQADSIFRSNHIEPRLNLAAVLAKCVISYRDQPMSDKTQRMTVFKCSFQYDHEQEALRPLDISLH